jgi:hypothetical protein
LPDEILLATRPLRRLPAPYFLKTPDLFFLIVLLVVGSDRALNIGPDARLAAHVFAYPFFFAAHMLSIRFG